MSGRRPKRRSLYALIRGPNGTDKVLENCGPGQLRGKPSSWSSSSCPTKEGLFPTIKRPTSPGQLVDSSSSSSPSLLKPDQDPNHPNLDHAVLSPGHRLPRPATPGIRGRTPRHRRYVPITCSPSSRLRRKLPQSHADNRTHPDTNVAAAVNTTSGGPLAAQRCRVNSQYRDLWVEDGMSRWRTVFSAEGTDPEGYCHYWKQFGKSHSSIAACHTSQRLTRDSARRLRLQHPVRVGREC